MALNRPDSAYRLAVLLARGRRIADHLGAWQTAAAACHTGGLSSRVSDPNVAPARWPAAAVQQRQAHFVAHRKHNQYFVPDDPDAYERAREAWRSPVPPRLPPRRPWPDPGSKMPRYTAMLTKEEKEQLLSGCTEAGLEERTAKRVLRAAERGFAPHDTKTLQDRIRGLLELQKWVPTLDVDRMLSLRPEALQVSPAALRARAFRLSKLLPDKDVGEVLTGGSRWAVLAPRELVSRVQGAEALWQHKLGQRLPRDHISNPSKLRRLVQGNTRRTARHMAALIFRHGPTTAAEMYRKCPSLLSYRPGVLGRKVATLARSLGVSREAAQQLVARDPGVLKFNAVNLRSKVAALGQLLGPAAQAAPVGGQAAAGAAEQANEAGSAAGAAANAGEGGRLGAASEAGAAAAVVKAVLQQQPSLLKYSPWRSKGAKGQDAAAQGLNTIAHKLQQLQRALGLTHAQVCSMAAAHPALLTRSIKKLGDTATALGSEPQGSALSLNMEAVAQLVVAVPAALGLSKQAVERRMQALNALAGLGPTWTGHMCDLAADRVALGQALTQPNGRYARLEWLVADRTQREPVPGALELLRMGEQQFRELHAGYPGDA